jgi:ubiquinone/menaquinone biosynthesis C-methylase UbiE
MTSESTPPVCSYEGSDYQTSFWEQGGREYEDRAEAIALKRLLPASGALMLELGAGAGRNTPRYAGYERTVLLDYSRTQLEQARQRLGDSPRYTYVAADIYRLPFVDGLFDGATMIRTLHHMADAPKALSQIRQALQPGATFILEFANKRNLKSILRFWAGKQTWSPFALEPVEFAALNFDFHPQTVFRWLNELGFKRERTLTVSHFRAGILKRTLPASLLASMDGFFQPTGAWFQLTPSVFVKAKSVGGTKRDIPEAPRLFFKCPSCGHSPLDETRDGQPTCPSCGKTWGFKDGIYNFREAAE